MSDQETTVQAAMTQRDIEEIKGGLAKLSAQLESTGVKLEKKMDELGTCISDLQTDTEVLKVRVDNDERELTKLGNISTGWNALNSIGAFFAGLFVILNQKP